MTSEKTSLDNGKSLVLVLGAGASKEVNLPIGEELKQDIANHLDIRFELGYSQESGDPTITQAYKDVSLSNYATTDINHLLEVSWFIKDAMPQAISIDNFIDSHRHDARIALCGKLAIVQCILEAERESALKIYRRHEYDNIDFGAISATWFNAFFKLLTENCQAGALPSRLKEISVISFNYDRCFEHYLYFSLRNYYGLSDADAAQLVALVDIYHPYGKVGYLPWMGHKPAETVKFGGSLGSGKLIAISQSLRTFAEGTDPSLSNIELIRATVNCARRIVFLGFAFHRLNLELLFPRDSGAPQAQAVQILGTGFGLSRSDIRHIGDEISDRAKFFRAGVDIQPDLTCAGLFHEYRRILSLA